tara:strand:+ start:447 stop:836 length:390 start_codon:yes stop_codon:yes gene_type:complete
MTHLASGKEGFTMTIENEIFYCFFDHDIIIDLKIAQGAIKKRNELMGDKALASLIDFRQVKYLLQGAKEVLFNKNGFFEGEPVAIIVNSFVIQTSIKFATSISTRPVSYQMCVSTKKAEEWLLKQRKKK